jgi:hypothetical protein
MINIYPEFGFLSLGFISIRGDRKSTPALGLVFLPSSNLGGGVSRFFTEQYSEDVQSIPIQCV